MAGSEPVGLIGTGFIGHGLADCLLAAGHALHVHDIHPERAKDLLERGAVFCDSARAVAEACGVVFMALVNDEQVEQVLFGEDGAGTGECAGKLFVDTATIPPERSRQFAGRLCERGADFLDAPLIGGHSEGCSETMPVGGTEQAFARCRPLLETVAKNVVHVGPSGCGEVVKLMNQTIACAQMACKAEAIAYAESMGVALEKADEALGGRDRAVGWLAESAKKQEAHGDPTHWTRLFLKDMNCAVRTGGMPVARAVRDLAELAMKVEPQKGWPYSFLAAARENMKRH